MNTDLHPHNLNETSTIGNNKIKQLTVVNHIKVIYLSLETIVSLSTHQYCQLSQYSCYNNIITSNCVTILQLGVMVFPCALGVGLGYVELVLEAVN